MQNKLNFPDLLLRSFSQPPLLRTTQSRLHHDGLFISQHIIVPIIKQFHGFLEADMSLLVSVKYIIVPEVFIVNIVHALARTSPVVRYVTKR